MDVFSFMPAILAFIGSLVGAIISLYIAKTKIKRELKTRFINQLDRELFDLCGDFIVDLSIDEINNIQAIGLRDEESYNINKSRASFNKLVLFLTRHKDIYGLEFKKQLSIVIESYTEITIISCLNSDHFISLQKASKSIESIKSNILRKLK